VWKDYLRFDLLQCLIDLVCGRDVTFVVGDGGELVPVHVNVQDEELAIWLGPESLETIWWPIKPLLAMQLYDTAEC
jgi:hypothetical protein